MDTVLELMRALITTTPERWISLARALPGELLSRPAAEGEWSAVECLVHLVDSEKVFQFRVQAFLDGRDFPDFNPDTDGSKPGAGTPLDLAEEFARLRHESLLMLEKLSPAALELRARHAELGMVTLKEMVHNWAGYDLNHTVQAERALMQPFIQGCGPWQKYFADHIKRPPRSAGRSL
jgi:hypothetical protein